MATKVVYNSKYGGFSLSSAGLKAYNDKRRKAKLPIIEQSEFIKRHDPMLVSVVETLGEKANGAYAKLAIREIPSSYETCYEISEYDGLEHVVCEKKNLVLRKLRTTDINDLSDHEARALLIHLQQILR